MTPIDFSPVSALTSAPTCLIILAPGAEEIEFITVADVLVRAGVTVTVAGADGAGIVAGSRGVALAARIGLDAVMGSDFTCVYLPGGNGSAARGRSDPRIQTLLSRQLAAAQRGCWLALICAAPGALIPGGHARGRTLTSFPALREELVEAGASWRAQPVVVDGHLITGQAAGSSLAFALALAARLTTPKLAATIAAQIIAPPAVCVDALLS